ncbi:DEAD/DEAH box helicase [Agaribacterium sp. ZY112]|uniref:DEAD/DEAH box helicase n=1 Tax=Agaribacterium sp. ZY112 TaxID=3233574 RepID=UPI003525BB39
MPPSCKTEHAIETLYQAYLRLDEYEQWLLKLLAVIYHPIGLSKLGKVLTSLGREIQLPSGKRIKALSSTNKNELVEKGFLEHNKSGLRLQPLLSNKLTQLCIEDNNYLRFIKHIEAVLPMRTAYEWQRPKDAERCFIRDIYFCEGPRQLEQIMGFDKNPQIIDLEKNQVLVELFFYPFKLDNFLALPEGIQYHSFATWFSLNCQQGHSNEYLQALLEQVCPLCPNNSNLQFLLAELYLFALRFDDAQQVINKHDKSCYSLQLQASAQLLQGEFKVSESLFKQALTAKNKFSRRKRQFIGGRLGLFYKLCLFVLASDSSHYYTELDEQIDAELRSKNTEPKFRQILDRLQYLYLTLADGQNYSYSNDLADELLDETPYFFKLKTLIHGLGLTWTGSKPNTALKKQFKQSIAFFSGTGLIVFSELAEQLLDAHKKTKNSRSSEPNASKSINVTSSMAYFPSLVTVKEEWDLALEKLIALKAQGPNKAKPIQENTKASRLIWEMWPEYGDVHFKAREQKQTKTGWSKGRPVALKRLAKEHESIGFLSETDKAMCAAITIQQSWDYYRSLDYQLSGIEALIAAKDLDNLYLEHNLEQCIELIQQEPELLISEQKDVLLLSISDLPPYFQDEENFSLRQLSDSRYSFIIFNESHIKVADIIGEGGLVIPKSAKAKVLESVSAIAPLLNIQSDLSELDTGLESINSIDQLVINIQPTGQGLQFTCMIMPFGDEGPAYKPMTGNTKLTAEVNGKRVATERDLLKEQVLLDLLDEHCPAFLSMHDNVLSVDDTQTSLEVLEQLETLITSDKPPLALSLRWPKGKKLTLGKSLRSEHLSLAVHKKNEWFELSGELTVDEGEVINLRSLLELVSSSGGRFIELDQGKILNLSNDLRQRLDNINQVCDKGKFHPLASVHVAEASSGMRMKTNHAWEDQAQLMHEANKITPTVPPTLQAELRDYQLQGFDWMSRLAHWKAGACLADDMGLGKTLQALALLLSRAADGPGLVIAPTSVCLNWQQEATKFAPTLNIRHFADYSTSEQRQQLLTELAAFDCVVISYGLLQRESKLLSQVEWHTIVADEAQALKNPLAKRSQAAFALRGRFKIITTGTPIENNLTELWSLFRFITPGLLGSLKGFGTRYAQPIENAKENKHAARLANLALKALIQPFILRRLKTQVLTELPPRTEINMPIELSDTEQAFYEALRQNAVENISKLSTSTNQGEQQIQMLAELVKLRQACCHPALVAPEVNLPSSKLTALISLLDELQQNHHKALIFSQFVGHLALIKEQLEQRGISYQYLDGSTPQKTRQNRVNAFQRGEGEVFLISLKAGGSGLNLTAADYVIHMDPWWNPAVEDQASDRAHRMGQKRPVTIYRLIAKNTIEQRIVELHQRKRDLADKLLSGNEQAAKLSVDDVLNILKESF